MIIIIIVIRLVQQNFMSTSLQVFPSSFVLEMFELLYVFTTSCADQTTERNAAAVVHVVRRTGLNPLFYMHTWYLIAVLTFLIFIIGK